MKILPPLWSEACRITWFGQTALCHIHHIFCRRGRGGGLTSGSSELFLKPYHLFSVFRGGGRRGPFNFLDFFRLFFLFSSQFLQELTRSSRCSSQASSNSACFRSSSILRSSSSLSLFLFAASFSNICSCFLCTSANILHISARSPRL